MRHCPRILKAGISPACAIAYTVFLGELQQRRDILDGQDLISHGDSSMVGTRG